MDRLVMKQLRHWYDSCDERLLFLAGAPRVGKSWLIERLCREKHERYITVSAHGIQSDDVEHAGIIVITDVNDKETLDRAKRIIFKIRAEERLSGYRIIIESRLIGDNDILYDFLEEEYVCTIRVYPMNIMEFAKAFSRKKGTYLPELLRIYLHVGGMPESVACFLESGSLAMVRCVQKKLLTILKTAYVKKSKEILDVIPLQLLKSESSFSYRVIKHNAREREYGQSVQLLEQQGVVHRLWRYGAKGYKLYLYDVGLVAASLDADMRFMVYAGGFTEYDNELVKCFIMEEYMACYNRKYNMYYWGRTRAKARLPFVMQGDNGSLIIPQLCMGKRYTKSLESFCELYKVDKVYRMYVDDVRYIEKKLSDETRYECVDMPLAQIGELFINSVIKDTVLE